jgi:hypothetical protein
MFTTTEKSLARYLNDQLADETLAVELASHASVEYGRSPLGNFLLLLSWALEEDRDSLASLMSRLGVRRKRVRMFVARIAQTARRISVAGASPAHTLAELESLDVHINRKLEMWNAMRNQVGERATGFDFDEFISRAEGQVEALEQRHLAALH